MGNRIRLGLAIITVLYLFSCQRNNCSNAAKIEVSDLLYEYSQQHSNNYCELLRKSVQGDREAIKKLSLLRIDDAAGYDHGAVLVELVRFIGEEKYVSSIITITPAEKKTIRSYIDVGLEYEKSPNSGYKSIKTTFPSLYDFLNI